ncbi:MAG: exonuclease subunit SbcD, partial [Epsilonproteobacteria bacterium]|nr:exonuclease subunit SbcD [Campylobacterota bacterium]
MKILHTSDWHLGQLFMGQSREEEHKDFLNTLLEIIKKESIDLLLITGDIFDTSTPPIYAQKLYFNFLSALKETNCRKCIITAGNHDSISFLESFKEILSLLSIEIVEKEGKI